MLRGRSFVGRRAFLTTSRWDTRSRPSKVEDLPMARPRGRRAGARHGASRTADAVQGPARLQSRQPRAIPGESVPRRFLGGLRRPANGRRSPRAAAASNWPARSPARQPADGARVRQPRLGCITSAPGSCDARATSASAASRRPIPSCSTGWPGAFVADGWSIKKLHRADHALERLPAVERATTPSARKVDPENRLLWSQNRRRLDFEAMRDSLLAVSGRARPPWAARPSATSDDARSAAAARSTGSSTARTCHVLMPSTSPVPDQHAPQRHSRRSRSRRCS